MNEKLRECPFCGGEARTYTKLVKGISVDIIRFSVRCMDCGIEQHYEIVFGANFEEIKAAMNNAIYAWNRRTDNGKV